MGKTAQGAVWLNEDQLSPYDYWQFWRNTEDADVGRFLRLFTDLPLDEIARLEGLPGAEINEAKIVLADEATAMLHGREAPRPTAEETARRDLRGGRRRRGSADAVGRRRHDIGLACADRARLLARPTRKRKRKIAEGAVRLDDEVGRAIPA